MKYKISYENPQTQYIPIEAEFDVSKSNKITLQFPAWRPGRYELGNFAKNIHGFKVKNENGKLVKFQKITKDSWEVETGKAKKIVVTYKYYAAELNAGSTFMDEHQLYVNPVNCLVYIEDRQKRSCQLTLDIPKDFRIACGAKIEKNIIKTKSYHELVDSPFIASNSLQHEQFKVKGVVFHLWFQGEAKIDFDKVIDDFTKFTVSQIEKFGKFPVEEYHYLFQIEPVKAYHGVEHQTSTVIDLGPTYDLFGSLYDDFLGVSSHELYHTWNIKAIRPVEMYPYDYAKENYSHLGFVAEGVTTYMGDLFLCESGVKNFDWYRKELETLLQRHFDNFGRFNYSVAESSWDTWLDGYVPGAPNRKVSIYNEGALLAFGCDMKIRKNSNNKSSLHDVMRDLYENFADKSKGYRTEDFRKLVEKYAEENLEELFEHHYFGTHSFEPILVEAFETIGFELKMDKNPNVVQDILGIKYTVENNATIVKQIAPGSAAELGMVMTGDEILTVNSMKVSDNLDKWIEYFRDDQIELSISRNGRIVNIVCPHTNKSSYPVYKITKSKNTSNLGKRIFKKWCGEIWDDMSNF